MGKPKLSKNTEFDPIEMIEKNAEMNRIDQNNQYGSSTYKQKPDGTYEFNTEFSPELKKMHERQMSMAQEGSIKDPLAHLGSQGGGAVGELMSSMFGKVSERYGGEGGGGGIKPATGGAPPAATASVMPAAAAGGEAAAIPATDDAASQAALEEQRRRMAEAQAAAQQTP